MGKLRGEDEVIVLTGKDKGRRGRVRQVLGGKLLVSGVNMVKKHTKPNPQQGVSGGIVEQEMPIQASNVAIFNPATERADRVGYRIEGGVKHRVFKSSGEPIDGQS